MRCPLCRTDNPVGRDVHYCRACGASLTAASASATSRLPLAALASQPLASATYALPWQVGVPVQTAVFPYGGFWVRFVALLVDGAILAVLGWFIGLAIEASLRVDVAGFEALAYLVALASNLADEVFLTGAIVSALGYEVVLTGAMGGTLGKVLLGYRVVDEQGRHIGYGRALGRALSKTISTSVFLLGFVCVGVDAYKQAWHDKVAGAFVIRKEFVRP
ncbi:MAG: RDD family protein [Chloroflexota bacterium]